MQTRMAMGRCCCAGGCLICADDFDRADNTDVSSGAPGGCGWTEGGDSAFEIDTNVMTHPDGSESTAVVGSIPAEFWAKITFSGPGTNDGDAVGICIGDSGHRFVIESVVGDSVGYDVFGLRVVGIEFSEVWMPFSEAPTSQDITLCVKRDSGYDYTVQVSTATDDLLCGAFLGQATGHDGGSVGVYAKGAATIKDFQISNVSGKVDCVTCSESCDAAFDDSFGDTPIRDYWTTGTLDPGSESFSVTGGSLRITEASDGLVRGSISTRTCKPDFSSITSLTLEMTRGGVSDAYSPDDPFGSTEVSGLWQLVLVIGYPTVGVGTNTITFTTSYVLSTGSWVHEARHQRRGGGIDINSTSGTSADGDTYAIVISNATGNEDTYRIEYHRNGVAIAALTATGEELGPLNTGSDEYMSVTASASLNKNAGGSVWVEIDRFRMFYT